MKAGSMTSCCTRSGRVGHRGEKATAEMTAFLDRIFDTDLDSQQISLILNAEKAGTTARKPKFAPRSAKLQLLSAGRQHSYPKKRCPRNRKRSP